MQLAVIAIAGAIGVSALGGFAIHINNKAYQRGVAACQEANQKVTDKLNTKIKTLNHTLLAERNDAKQSRESKTAELVASNTGDACIPDDAYRGRLNGILRQGG